eukprot:CAMPEP_0197075214 /NCGR_PEP_ID=MMETSP1384-20130603/211499_1 /TAXON_ID=29189 /ORGANISM="Ammonia sp." /LENGTH=395 /DNA_ID=CAMNT_0042514057 /DNA_START=18 /DNA_END=1205 /DNA_ORIENTATION=-
MVARQYTSIMAVLLTMTNIWMLCLSASASQRPLISDPPDTRSRSLLSDGALQVFAQRSESGQILSVEVPTLATVGDLYRATAAAFSIRPQSLQLNYQGTAMTAMDEPLADTGISQEAMIEVSIKRNTDVVDFLNLFDEQSLSHYFSAEDLHRIKALNEEAWQRGSDDLSKVIMFMNDHSTGVSINYRLSREWRSPRIISMEINRMDADLKWQHLPKQTEFVTLTTGSIESIDLSSIRCDKLRVFSIKDLHHQHRRLELNGIERCVRLEILEIINHKELRQFDNLRVFRIDDYFYNLRRLELNGIERCVRLETLYITGHKELRQLDLRPLRHCHRLKELYLYGNGLEDLDLSPLRECAALETLNIKDNPFGREEEQIIEPLKSLTWAESGRLHINF